MRVALRLANLSPPFSFKPTPPSRSASMTGSRRQASDASGATWTSLGGAEVEEEAGDGDSAVFPPLWRPRPPFEGQETGRGVGSE